MTTTAKPERMAWKPVTLGQAEPFNKALHHRAYPHREPKSSGRRFFVDDGRRRVCVGTLVGGVFVKRVRDSHILRKPAAIAMQDDVLAQLRKAGCHTVKAVLDGGRVLQAPIERYAVKGFPVCRGYGAQTALALAQWDEPCGQASLFGGVL